MELLNKNGFSKLIEECTYPITGLKCVSRIYTNVATFEIRDDGVYVLEIVSNISFRDLQKLIPFSIKIVY